MLHVLQRGKGTDNGLLGGADALHAETCNRVDDQIIVGLEINEFRYGMAPTETSKVEKESCIQSLDIGCLVPARSILLRCQPTAFLGSSKEKPAEALVMHVAVDIKE